MPYDDPAPTDPLTLCGVVVEAQDDRATHEMAECFVEEFVRSGLDADRILRMFKMREYAGPFLAYQTLGEEAIRLLILDHRERRGFLEQESVVEHRASGDIGLVVLD